MKEEINDLPELIDIFFHCYSYLFSMKRIHSRIVKDVSTELNSSAEKIISWVNKIKFELGKPAMFDVGGGGITKLEEFTHQFIPFGIAQKILANDFWGLFPEASQ